MKRSIFISFLIVFFTVFCNAQPITKQQAEQKAMAFMQQKGIPVGRGITSAPLTQITTVGKTPLFVFNATDSEGFVIVSGDERTEEILGYSTDSRFDEKKISETMREWLTEYATQINDLQMGRMKANPLKVSSHEAIGKMVSSVWDQGEISSTGNAYNLLCPTYQGNHCLTGCVATAMAQIMRYHEWPTDYCSQIPGYISNDNIGYVDMLPKLKFDWSNMLDRYDEGQNTQECNAVAQLMQYCGSAVEMDYSIGSSNARLEDVALALKTYFDYDVNTRLVYRSDYSAEGWDNLIYNELKNGRPVLYHGYKLYSGHIFVCDGYDGNGFYHINWGWSDYCNGYFKLAILNPNTGNIGYTYSTSSYSIDQSAIVGIQKPTGTTEEERTLSLEEFYCDGHTITAIYLNYTGIAGTFDYGFAYKEASGNSYQLMKNTESLEPMNGRYYTLDLDNLNLSDGIYYFYPYAILSGNPWFHMIGDYTKYFEVVISGGNVSTIIKHPVENCYIKSIECVGNRIVNQPQELQITIKNDGEEFNDTFYLHVSNTDENLVGYVDQVCLPIESGGQEIISLFFTPSSTGKWKVWVDNTWDGSSGTSRWEFEIIDAPTSASNLSVESYEIISNTDAIFKATIKNNGTAGYYMPIHCYLYEPPSKSYNIDFQQTRNMNIAPGETADVEFRFESLEMGKTYIVCMGAYKYHNSYEMEWIGYSYNFTVDKEGDPTDIVNITTNLISPVDIYTLSGVLLREKATTFEGLPEGIYIVEGRKVVIRR